MEKIYLLAAALLHHVLNDLCLFLPLNVLFRVMAITVWQSQCIDTKGFGFILQGVSAKQFLNHLASLPANSKL